MSLRCARHAGSFARCEGARVRRRARAQRRRAHAQPLATAATRSPHRRLLTSRHCSSCSETRKIMLSKKNTTPVIGYW